MTLLLTIAALITALIVTLLTCVQLLYLEAMRIRSRDLPALQYFKEVIEPRIGLGIERGALTFSLIKHMGLTLLGCLAVAITITSAPIWEALSAAILGTALFTILGTNLVPHLIYRKTQATALLSLVPLLRLLAMLFAPITWTVEFTRSLFGLDGGNGSDPGPEREEPIEALINAGEEEGIIEKGDRELIQSVMAFGDKTVREVLTPRPDIVAISQDATLEELRQLVISEQYSRIPVFEKDIDTILGFVHVRDMFERDKEVRERTPVRAILRPIRAVPETKPVNDLLKEMQDDGTHMAVVVDEYGSTAGIVTMEDMVEEIVGEIHDEHEPDRDFEQRPDGSFIVAGNFDLDRLHDLIGFQPDGDTESTTIGGLVTEWLGHVPAVGEESERGGINIKVLAANNLRVDQVRVCRSTPK